MSVSITVNCVSIFFFSLSLSLSLENTQSTTIASMPTEYAADTTQLVAANDRVVCYALKNGGIRVLDQLNGAKCVIKAAHTGRIVDLRLHASALVSEAGAVAAEAQRAERQASGAQHQPSECLKLSTN